jgi:hypothetical protein
MFILLVLVKINQSVCVRLDGFDANHGILVLPVGSSNDLFSEKQMQLVAYEGEIVNMCLWGNADHLPVTVYRLERLNPFLSHQSLNSS